MTRRVLGFAAGVVVVAAGLVFAVRQRPTAAVTPTEPQWTPLPRNVQVEVLNTSKVSGMARVGTLVLRRAGLNVVYYGNGPASLGSSPRNRVIVRRGDTTGVGRVVQALGDAEIVVAPDETRMVDLTVVLGDKGAGH